MLLTYIRQNARKQTKQSFIHAYGETFGGISVVANVCVCMYVRGKCGEKYPGASRGNVRMYTSFCQTNKQWKSYNDSCEIFMNYSGLGCPSLCLPKSPPL